MLPQPDANPLLEAFLSDPEQAFVGFGLDGAIFLWNQTAEVLYGFTQAEVLGKSVACLLPLYELPAHEELLHNPSSPESRMGAVAERLNKSGLRISVRIQRSPIRDAHGEIIGILERAHALAPGNACSVAEAHLRLLVEQIPLFFWTTDERLRITSHWDALPARRVVFPAILSARRSTNICAAGKWRSARQAALLALRGLSSRWNMPAAIASTISPSGLTAIPGRDHRVHRMALDITERKKTEDEILFRASHDGLTGLANYRNSSRAWNAKSAAPTVRTSPLPCSSWISMT